MDMRRLPAAAHCPLVPLAGEQLDEVGEGHDQALGPLAVASAFASVDAVRASWGGQPLSVNTQNWPDVWKNMTIGGSRQPAFTGYQ